MKSQQRRGPEGDRNFHQATRTQAERVWAEFVSGNFFDVLGVRPVTGRFFRTEEQEGAPGKHPVAVISERFWQRHFHADPEIVGKAVRLNGRELTVIGVAPAEFLGTIVGLSYDFWLPLSMESLLSGGGNGLEYRGARWLHVLTRLRPGVSLPQARAEIQTIARRLAQSYPQSNAGISTTLAPISQAPYGTQEMMAPLLETLLGYVAGMKNCGHPAIRPARRTPAAPPRPASKRLSSSS